MEERRDEGNKSKCRNVLKMTPLGREEMRKIMNGRKLEKVRKKRKEGGRSIIVTRRENRKKGGT